MNSRIEDLTGRRFGNLVVKEFHDVNEHRSSRWVCECDCGNVVIVARNRLTTGNTTSCGCKLHKIDDLTGKRFGKLSVIGLDHQDARGKTYWLCECDCRDHNRVVKSRSSLIHGGVKSCGCLRHHDLSGKRFGRLTVVDIDHVDYNSIYFWRCVCDCGNEVVVRNTSLNNGMTKSCGCYAMDVRRENSTKHGLSEHPLYVVWTDMKRRCSKEYDPAWPNYGGRGIKVCSDWEHDFKKFYDWASNNGWEPGLTLDRKNNDDGYNPNNCRFVDMRTQCNNRRSNRLIKYGGEVHSVAQWSDILGVEYFRLTNRINHGNFHDFEDYFGFTDPDGGDL